jgi:hypothetical protein
MFEGWNINHFLEINLSSMKISLCFSLKDSTEFELYNVSNENAYVYLYINIDTLT